MKFVLAIFYILLAIVLSACPKEGPPPPKMEICILDGLGGGDCIEKDDSTRYRAPSEMETYWCTPQHDMATFASWCYDVNQLVIEKEMNKLKEKAMK